MATDLMPRRCTICTHDKRETIERALIEHRPFRAITVQGGVRNEQGADATTALLSPQRKN